MSRSLFIKIFHKKRISPNISIITKTFNKESDD